MQFLNRYGALALLGLVGFAMGCQRSLAPSSPNKSEDTAAPTNLVDRRALNDLVAKADASHSDALVVFKDGQLVGSWHSGGKRRRIEAMSITKSIANLAIGRLITLGKIESVDQPMYTWFPEWKEGPKSEITLRHVLNHTSGLQAAVLAKEIYRQRDFVRFALDADLTDKPGTKFFYNNKAVNLLAAVVEQAAGQKLDEFLREDLLAKLKITDFRWTRDKAGNPHVMAGFQVLPEDLARIGQFTLDRGRWEGEQLIDESWFDLSLGPGSALNPYCGLLWWRTPEINAYIIDDEWIETLRKGGAPEIFLEKTASIRGHYDSWNAATNAFAQAFGRNFMDVINETLQPLKLSLTRKEYGELESYNANGGFGQWLVVYPRERLIGVRMKREPFFKQEEADYFNDFADKLKNVIQ